LFYYNFGAKRHKKEQNLLISLLLEGLSGIIYYIILGIKEGYVKPVNGFQTKGCGKSNYGY